jgi:catechol 2,3-dioxygenase-like lactoylglutathione lyase family enzyme
MEVIALHHVNVTVPTSIEEAAKHFYGVVMGLPEVPKPEESKGRGGAWYQLGTVQLHLSRDDAPSESRKRHVCYQVRDLAQAEQRFREAGVEIIPDDMPVAGWPRFYVHDPGGNRIEVAQAG